MMQILHPYVKFRNSLIDTLENLSADQSINSAIKQLELVMSENTDTGRFKAHDKLDQSIVHFKEVLSNLEKIQEHNFTTIEDTNEKIDQIASQLKSPLVENFSFQVFQLDNTISQMVLDRMQKYVGSSYPGLRLGCRYVGQNEVDENRQLDNSLSILFSNQLVALDPLYFCDVNESLISQATDHFNEAYKNRIRKYTVVNHDLSILPTNQFGFIFCWWVFNFKTIDSIKDYLKNVYDLLRPGGTFMFSYNNSDIFESARLVDMQVMSHVPYRHLVKLCDEIGFLIDSNLDVKNSDPLVEFVSWLEIKKPGTLKTVKLKQVLGKIESKN